jgi:hypothetical protein
MIFKRGNIAAMEKKGDCMIVHTNLPFLNIMEPSFSYTSLNTQNYTMKSIIHILEAPQQSSTKFFVLRKSVNDVYKS